MKREKKPMVTTSIRVPKDLRDRLQIASEKLGMTRTNLIRNVLQKYADKQQ